MYTHLFNLILLQSQYAHGRTRDSQMSDKRSYIDRTDITNLVLETSPTTESLSANMNRLYAGMIASNLQSMTESIEVST